MTFTIDVSRLSRASVDHPNPPRGHLLLLEGSRKEMVMTLCEALVKLDSWGGSPTDANELALEDIIGFLTNLSDEEREFEIETSLGGKADWTEFHSWRGDCSHLAFSPSENASTANQALDGLRRAVGKTVYGWKGGEYVVYPSCGVHIDTPRAASNAVFSGVRAEGGKVILEVSGCESVEDIPVGEIIP